MLRINIKISFNFFIFCWIII